MNRLVANGGKWRSLLPFSRLYGSSNGGEYPRESLSVPVQLPVSPFQSGSSNLEFDSGQNVTQISTLSNGLRVASQSSFGQYSNIGGQGMFYIIFCENFFNDAVVLIFLVGVVNSLINCIFPLVFIDAGSRYEVRYKGGVSQFLQKLAFQVILILIF